LDGWRGLAIAAVIEGHFVGLLPGRTGRLGVDAFFALSGYLMAGLLFIGRQPLKTFYKRRISRILPVFLVFTLTVYGLALLLGWSFTNAEFWATPFVSEDLCAHDARHRAVSSPHYASLVAQRGGACLRRDERAAAC
jgi:peptidoglycan/LPS O-acetylase OafA/YrhL